MAEQRARHARILVEARRHADRIGKVEAEQSLREALVVRRGGPRVEPKLETLDGEIMRPLGRKREQQALAQAEQPAHADTPCGRMCGRLARAQRLGPQHRGKIERRVKMRKQRAAARRLPFQLGPETLRIDGEQHETGLAGEMLGQRAFELMGGGEMDEAVADIVGRAFETPFAPRPFVGGFGQDFIDGLGHGRGDSSRLVRPTRKGRIAVDKRQK